VVSGLYFYELRIENSSFVGKIIFIK